MDRIILPATVSSPPRVSITGFWVATVIELEAIRETQQHETPVSYANLATNAAYWCCQMLNLLATETNIIGSRWCGPITRGDQ